MAPTPGAELVARYTSAAPRDPHPTAPAFLEAARQMGMAILDDVNGPMRPGAGYINMNIAADGTRVSCRSRLPASGVCPRPNLTLLLNTNVVEAGLQGHSLCGRRRSGHERRDEDVRADTGSDPCRRRHRQPEAPDALGRRGREGASATSASTSSRTCPGLARTSRTTCSCPAWCSSTRARCRTGRPTAMPSRQRPTCRVVPRAIPTSTWCSSSCPRSHPRPPRALERRRQTPSRSRRPSCSRRAGAPSGWPATTFRTPPSSMATISAPIRDSGGHRARHRCRARARESARLRRCARPAARPRPQRDGRGDPGTGPAGLGELWTSSGHLQDRRGQLAVVDPQLRVHGLLGLARGRRIGDAADHHRADERADPIMIAGRASRLVLGRNA